ncbi:hypothetical protein, partial [uncultured Methanobrevibacter sp.]|uniref:hypothetical protein n=1 Tax=uncultured Methanobrevibacter sp. TaxID=253161 RepID=UPI0025E65C87
RFAMLGASAALIGFMFSQTIKSIREYKKIAAEKANFFEKGKAEGNIMNDGGNNIMNDGGNNIMNDGGNNIMNDGGNNIKIESTNDIVNDFGGNEPNLLIEENEISDNFNDMNNYYNDIIGEKSDASIISDVQSEGGDLVRPVGKPKPSFGKYTDYDISNNNIGQIAVGPESTKIYTIDGKVIDQVKFEDAKFNAYTADGEKIYDGMTLYDADGAPIKFNEKNFCSQERSDIVSHIFTDKNNVLYDSCGNPFYAHRSNVKIKYVEGNDYFTQTGKKVDPKEIVLNDDGVPYDMKGNPLYRVRIGTKNYDVGRLRSIELINYKGETVQSFKSDVHGYVHDNAGNLLLDPNEINRLLKVIDSKYKPTFKDIFWPWYLPDVSSNPDDNYKGNYSGDLGLDIDLEDGAFAKYVSPNDEQEAIVYPIL